MKRRTEKHSVHAVALLSAADEHAGHLYERIGFRPYATLLAYADDVA